jgi:hypothetical protein
MQQNATEKPPSGEKLTVTPKQSMKISGLSQRKTYAFLKSGILPAIWGGKGYLIPVAGLQEFLLKRAQQESEELKHKNAIAVDAPR